jgi:hypothetical protein
VSLYHETGWNFVRIGPFSLQFTDAGGSSTITFSTGRYAHSDLSSVMGTGEYTDFATALAAALNADTTLSGTFTVTWNAVTGAYTVARTAGTFSIANPSGTVAGQILGRTTAAVAVASFTSDVRAHYSIETEHGAKSQVSGDYEPDAIVEGGHTTSGGHFAISTLDDPITFHDFMLMLEPRARVFTQHADPGEPWTYEAFFKHARGTEPFSLYDGSSHEVFTLRPDAARFKPERAVADWDDRWNLALRCYLEGRIP